MKKLKFKKPKFWDDPNDMINGSWKTLITMEIVGIVFAAFFGWILFGLTQECATMKLVKAIPPMLFIGTYTAFGAFFLVVGVLGMSKKAKRKFPILQKLFH